MMKREKVRQIGDDKSKTKLVRAERDAVAGYFLEICQAAADGDQQRIDELRKKEFFTLNVKRGYAFGLITPAGYLEMIDNQRAADFLLKNGADVDYMGFGAALNGDIARAEYLRKNYGADPTVIARGAACGGFHLYAKWLYADRGANKFDILLGLITGGYYKSAVEFIEEYNVFMPHMRESEFWQAVGMSEGRLTPDLQKIYEAFLDGFLSGTDTAYLHQIYRGAGMSGNYKIDPDTDPQLKKSFYNGSVKGGHLECLPESIYLAQPKVHSYDIKFHLGDAMEGCNLDFLDRCREANKSDRSAMKEYYQWAYYMVSVSNDIQLINSTPTRSSFVKDFLKYGHRLPDYHFLDIWDYTYNTLSFIFKTRNQDFLTEFTLHYLVDVLPNEKIATFLMAFDDNEAFKEKLSALFATLKPDSWDYKRLNYDFSQAYSSANKIRTLMLKYKFNYDQAYALVKYPDFRNFLMNTCKDVTQYFDRDVCSVIASELGRLQAPDVSDLIVKLRYHRHIIQDILHIADEFTKYAVTHETEQGKHAASLASVLAETRKNTEVVDLLSHELQLLQDAKDKATAQPASGISALMQSTAGFFSVAAKRAKGLYQTDSAPAHEKSYQSTGDDGYEAMVRNAMTSCMRP